MKKILLVLFLALSASMFAQTTYHQNQQYSWRSSSLGYIETFGLNFTAQDQSKLDVTWLDEAPNQACAGVPNDNLGFLFYEVDGATPACHPLTAVSYGPTIQVGNCKGPGSVHMAFDTGTLDFTLTYVYRDGRFPACYAESLTGTATVQ